eukprot:TRINITY_DN11021_c0_g5_i1.p2 TRINITY_DN11021_c0_g5~~TRINITY_DN11021_c0_g5_i1.p2  ORF type:complete len:303 (-),score=45.25 TRINITY_DN11021_c0_g5_i1:1933-2784(-)
MFLSSVRARVNICGKSLSKRVFVFGVTEGDKRSSPERRSEWEVELYWGSAMSQWKSSQKELVEYLKSSGNIQTDRVARAMLDVDRGKFLEEEMPSGMIYADQPLPLGDTQQTISAPHMHAAALEFLQSRLVPGARVLDVGAGTGYLTACFGELVKPNGYVLGVEKFQVLSEQAKKCVARAKPELLDQGIVKIVHGNIYSSDILKNEEAFDAIHVGAAAEELPKILIDKMKNGGLMMIPVGPNLFFQRLKLVRKTESGEVEVREGSLVRYVPLTKPSELGSQLQ